jgi:hypothetical protein
MEMVVATNQLVMEMVVATNQLVMEMVVATKRKREVSMTEFVSSN